MLKRLITNALVSIGNIGAKVDINTNSPIIHYQPILPESIERQRENKFKNKH